MKIVIFVLMSAVSIAAIAQTPSTEIPPPDLPAKVMPSNGGTIPPARSPDRNCAEIIGSAPPPTSAGEVSPRGAEGAPPTSSAARATGCDIELPDKSGSKQNAPEPKDSSPSR